MLLFVGLLSWRWSGVGRGELGIHLNEGELNRIKPSTPTHSTQNKTNIDNIHRRYYHSPID